MSTGSALSGSISINLRYWSHMISPAIGIFSPITPHETSHIRSPKSLARTPESN